ncbi:hypothetical protein ACO0LM_11790 [Undibacterium sp. Di26W]|uniref:hypothetical protein n=1 Tax=Undibacterium sp. Di26W TaxID=3413035 RepID=UPI003BF08F44
MQDDQGNEFVVPPHSVLEEMRNRIQSLEIGLMENTEATKRTEAGTAQLMEILESFRGAFKVLGWIGALAKPFAAIIGLGTAIWLAWVAKVTHPTEILPPK